MPRYIDADKLHYARVRILHNDGTVGGYNAVVPSAEIKDAPTADVAPIIHAKWRDDREYCNEFMCTNCNEFNINNFYPYCPYCGAKMDGGSK